MGRQPVGRLPMGGQSVGRFPMGRIAVGDGGGGVMTRRIPWLGPRWRVVVTAVATLGAAVFLFAVADLLLDGVERPMAMAVGCAATVAINRIYVLVTRRGGVLEGIDIAELAIVALVLSMPPAEALVAFIAASLVVEATMDRAVVKKVYNVGVRAMAAGVLVFIVQGFAPYGTVPHAGQYAAA